MKKALCAFAAFVFVLTSFCFTALGQDSIPKTQLGDSSTYYEYDSITKTLTVTGEGAIPDMKNMDGSQPWYDWRSDGSIEHVVIGEGITRIGNYAFYSVKAGDFTIPGTLKTIGRYAFSSSDIQQLELPFGLTQIESYAFDGCTALGSIILPDTLTTIGSYAFRLCNTLESVVIPYSVTSIGSYAFDRCTSLNSAVFEDLTSSVSIANYAFYDCSSLMNITVPESATVGKKTFAFGRNGALSGVSLSVYDGSAAHIYAVSNSVPYTLTDGTYPLLTGLQNTVAYDEGTTDKAYTFTYAPQFSGEYNFYSRGDIDVKAELYTDDTKLADSDDISVNDRNFCITYNLIAGKEYNFKVYSMNEQGSAKVVIYPDVINSFDIDGSLTFNASDGFHGTSEPIFPIIDSALSDFVLTVHFDGGFTDKIYYAAGYFDNKQIRIYDTQSTAPFTCGDNTEQIAIGDVQGGFTVHINHSYTGTAVPYTVDEDGYTIYTCMLCGDEYIGDIIESPAITVSGRCFLASDTDGSVNYDVPLANCAVTFNGNPVTVDSDGRFSFRTLDSGELVISNPYCDDTVYTVNNELRDINFGAIALPAYDLNGDGYINGRDLAVYKTQLRNTLGRHYFDYAVNFM